MLVALLMLVFVFGLAACRKEQSATQSVPKYRVVVVKKRVKPEHLSFASSIEPLQVKMVPAPYAGTIDKMFFSYGEYVKQSQLLFRIKSSELAKQYRKHVTDYLKAKNDYLMSQNKFQGSKQLYQAELINRNEFETEESALHNGYFSYINQEQALQRFFVAIA